MIFSLIIGIALGAVSVIFALQNVTVVTLTFFTWQFEGSLALILLLAIVMGTLISLLIVLPESVKNYFRYKRLKKVNEKLEGELKKQKELTVFAKKTPASAEEIAQINQGSIANSSSNIPPSQNASDGQASTLR
ncbi:MAG: LapA family protein [bacterium]|nr:LapA family protein [bacterium]